MFMQHDEFRIMTTTSGTTRHSIDFRTLNRADRAMWIQDWAHVPLDLQKKARVPRVQNIPPRELKSDVSSLSSTKRKLTDDNVLHDVRLASKMNIPLAETMIYAVRRELHIGELFIC